MGPIPTINLTDQVLLVKFIMQQDGKCCDRAVQWVSVGQDKIVVRFLFLFGCRPKGQFGSEITQLKMILTPGLAVFVS